MCRGGDRGAAGRVAEKGGQAVAVEKMPAPLIKKKRRSVQPVDVEAKKDAAAALPCADVGEEGGGGEEDVVVLVDRCGGMDAYEILGEVGAGTYGVVLAAEKKTNQIVAVKKMKLDRAAVREISTLRSLPRHPCIVGLKEVVSDGGGGPIRDVYMVMEYMDYDLGRVIQAAKQPLTEGNAKYLMYQLLHGVSFLHAKGVLHRDLKTSNLLLGREGELKVCDFGLSRRCVGGIGQQQPYTDRVGTLWYKAPELLLMALDGYSSAVDMWSVGCIMAELLRTAPLFPGSNELDQMRQIFAVLGVPDETTWPGFDSLCAKMHVAFACGGGGGQPCSSSKLKEKLPPVSEEGYDLLVRLLTYDPSRRLTAEEALNHPWFRQLPVPTWPPFLPEL